jgi:23S rRNA pseudouridine2605 synthase
MSRDDSDALSGVRLQKVLAGAGLGSRRHCEELIAAGRVRVDGRRVTELGTRVDPRTQAIEVDGARIPTREGLVYLVLNKPRGMLSTMHDERGRPCVGDLVAGRSERLFHVGRLDADSEGLLLLTNDGELANLLMHPSHGVAKTYLVEIAGSIPPGALRAIRGGVDLEDGPVRVGSCRVVGTIPGRTLVEVVLHEGRKHVVRRLFAAVGHPVVRLVRTRLGDLPLGELRPGRMRRLAPHEVLGLYRAATSA